MKMRLITVQKISLSILCILFLYLFSVVHSSVVNRSDFPDEFFFGASTSSYQVEGAYLEGNKSLSNWDVFNHRPGNSLGNNGDISDDHYHRYLEDVEILHSLGVNAYRLSISWPRILPSEKFGKVKQAGVSFYNKILDNLLLKGIEPFVTIYHHDFPQELEDRFGSWLSPLMQEEFVHYAEVCFTNFGDRVKHWVTINEPNLFSDMAYIRGRYPPARCSQPFGNCSAGNLDVEPLISMHNHLLAHAKAVNLYRQRFQAKQGGEIGIVETADMYEPMTDSKLDRDAAKRILGFQVAWTYDPLVFGDYPPEMRRYHGSELPTFSMEEKKLLKGSIDFIGLNHYTTLYAKDCLHSSCPPGYDRAIRGFVYTTGERDGVPIGVPSSNEHFFIVPRGMEKIVNYVKNRYHNKPMYILENGYSPAFVLDNQEDLNDLTRVEFYKQYLAYLAKAIRNDADVRGYFAWSLMDNYEWTRGYEPLYGLYHIDRQTLARTPKLSAKWYKSFLTNSRDKSSKLTGISSFTTKGSIISDLRPRQAEM